MRYKLTMINRNGYTIEHEAKTVKSLKEFSNFYPLSSFFCWIYDKSNDVMIAQNDYGNTWKKCNNKTFIPYW